MKPIILIVFLGGTCYVSWNTVRSKNKERRAGGGSGGGSSWGNKKGGFGAMGRGAKPGPGGSKGFGGGGLGGRKRR